MAYTLRSQMRAVVLAVAFFAIFIRLVSALNAWQLGQNTEIQSYAFCVVFPASLLLLFAFMGTARTKEGMLMRFGSMLQLLLILCLPSFALYLALGFPVVFFAVEIFCTRIPRKLAQPIERAILA
ncbi:MAG: hypothetical protein V4735_03940 [Pseudomonadota bacterium]